MSKVSIAILYVVAILQSYGQISVLAILEIFLGALVSLVVCLQSSFANRLTIYHDKVDERVERDDGSEFVYVCILGGWRVWRFDCRLPRLGW